MAEHPIIFTALMVRAILDGRQTQTRRRLKGKPPKFATGDTLWVRERWTLAADDARPDGFPVYLADGTPKAPHGPWRSPIHMPRWASRITLEVTDVRVERVQDIGEEDAKAEGVDWEVWEHGGEPIPPTSLFHELWDSINAKRGYGWDANPWVWVVSFKRIQP